VLIANAVWKQSAALEVAASQRSGTPLCTRLSSRLLLSDTCGEKTAIYLGDLAPGLGLASLWQQDGSVKLLMTSPLAGNLVDYPYVGMQAGHHPFSHQSTYVLCVRVAGVEFNGSILWNQNADVAIILETPATTKGAVPLIIFGVCVFV
jgi:hypothetical protein